MTWLLRTGCIAVATVLLVCHPAAQGQTLVIHHNANLRASASTQSAILAHLDPGAELTLLASNQTAGFYHGRTADGVEGWVYHTLGHVEETDEIPSAPPGAAATAFDPAWARPSPTGSIFTGPPGTQPCPADGEAGGDTGTNRLKNRTDVPASYHQVAFSTVAALPYPDANTKRSKWTPDQLAAIAPFEGVAVSVEGFIVAVKKQSGGGGEETNCHFNQPNFVDVHVALVAKPGDGEKDAVVVESTPRFYAKHPTWVYSTLKDLDHSADPVRISGWTLLDPVHKGHIGTYRSTLWEIHPITRIEVFRNGGWTLW
jgi:hypothetical protein